MARRQIEVVHIGDRASVELRQRWVADRRSSHRLEDRRGGSAAVGFFGAGIAAPGSPIESNKYDDAHRVRDYIGDDLVKLDDSPDLGRQCRVKYLAGEATFYALFVRGDRYQNSMNQIAYVAHIKSHYNHALHDGRIFLLAACNRSIRFSNSRPEMTA